MEVVIGLNRLRKTDLKSSHDTLRGSLKLSDAIQLSASPFNIAAANAVRSLLVMPAAVKYNSNSTNHSFAERPMSPEKVDGLDGLT